MKNFFQDNQLLIYSVVALIVIACAFVGISALLEQGTTQEVYYDNGELEQKHYYRGDESIEKTEFYSEQGELEQVAHYREGQESLDRVDTFYSNGSVQFKHYYRTDNSSERLEEYRADGTLSSITYTDEDGLNTTEYYDENGDLIP